MADVQSQEEKELQKTVVSGGFFHGLISIILAFCIAFFSFMIWGILIWQLPGLHERLGPGGNAGTNVIIYALVLSLFQLVLSIPVLQSENPKRWHIILGFFVVVLALFIILGIFGAFYTTSGFG